VFPKMALHNSTRHEACMLWMHVCGVKYDIDVTAKMCVMSYAETHV